MPVNHNFETCTDCQAYRKGQQALAQQDASFIKNVVTAGDTLTNHIGNAAYSLTLFVQNMSSIPYNLLNGIPWLNMIFMIIGGMFRIASTMLIKDYNQDIDPNDAAAIAAARKKRYLYLIPGIILGIGAMAVGIAGMVVFSFYLSLVLMVVSAAIDLVSSLIDVAKTVHDFIGKTQEERKEHGVKIALRVPNIIISITALVGCVLLITMPPVGGAILTAIAIASIGYFALDVSGKNPVRLLYNKLAGIEEKPEPTLSSSTKQCQEQLRYARGITFSIDTWKPTKVDDNNKTKRLVIRRWENQSFFDLIKLFFNPKAPSSTLFPSTSGSPTNRRPHNNKSSPSELSN